MKTVILFGSPSRRGFTSLMVEELIASIGGEIEVISAYEGNVRACTDCKYCDLVINTCKIDDDMQKVYEIVKNADNIIIASPIHVAAISAPLLAILSRFQIYFATKFVHKQELPLKEKKGYLLVSSGTEWEGHLENVELITKTAFLELNTKYCGKVYFPNTDQVKMLNEEQRNKIKSIAKEINKGE